MEGRPMEVKEDVWKFFIFWKASRHVHEFETRLSSMYLDANGKIEKSYLEGDSLSIFLKIKLCST